MSKFFLNCRAKWNRRKRMKKRKAQDAALEKFLDSPMFKKALAEVQAQRRERRLAERQQAEKNTISEEITNG